PISSVVCVWCQHCMCARLTSALVRVQLPVPSGGRRLPTWLVLLQRPPQMRQPEPGVSHHFPGSLAEYSGSLRDRRVPEYGFGSGGLCPIEHKRTLGPQEGPVTLHLVGRKCRRWGFIAFLLSCCGELACETPAWQPEPGVSHHVPGSVSESLMSLC